MQQFLPWLQRGFCPEILCRLLLFVLRVVGQDRGKSAALGFVDDSIKTEFLPGGMRFHAGWSAGARRFTQIWKIAGSIPVAGFGSPEWPFGRTVQTTAALQQIETLSGDAGMQAAASRVLEAAPDDRNGGAMRAESVIRPDPARRALRRAWAGSRLAIGSGMAKGEADLAPGLPPHESSLCAAEPLHRLAQRVRQGVARGTTGQARGCGAGCVSPGLRPMMRAPPLGWDGCRHRRLFGQEAVPRTKKAWRDEKVTRVGEE